MPILPTANCHLTIVSPPGPNTEALSISATAQVVAMRPLRRGNTPNPRSLTSQAQVELSAVASSNEANQRDDAHGGYGWAVVFACFVHTFWLNAWTGSWGILQVALLKQTLQHSSSSTVSFVGSLGLALGTGLGVPAVMLARRIGARNTGLLGITIYGVGNIVSAEAVHSVGGLFIASGVLYGLGGGCIYAMSNILPVQWFDKRLGTANGIIKLGGGIGATVMAIVAGMLTEKVGIAWTFRIFGLASLGTGIPVAFLIKERRTAPRNYNFQLSIFKELPFSFIFGAGAVGIFALYAPPFFLPYVTNALGFDNTTSTGVVACFNACMAIGRLISGIACDKLGTMNMVFLTMALNTITFFAVWSVSYNLATLLVFAVTNGIANGAFFVTMPTAVSRLLGKDRAADGISIALAGWCPGLLVGNPIAGALIDVMGADKATSIVPFRPAVFYAGGTALASTVLVAASRLVMNKSVARM
uniref:Major facilitator superfamily (MFS) profile domain-containing protein n=1 Tax=Bionectria ochroleuca TaxID=29856 RepID=A0A0B7KQV0_BIOOC